MKNFRMYFLVFLLATTGTLATVFDAPAKTYTFKDPQGFFAVDVQEEAYPIRSSRTDQQTTLRVYQPLKPNPNNRAVMAVNGGGHDPSFFIPFAMRFVARGITFCTIGWPGYEEKDDTIMSKTTFASVVALYEEAAKKVAQMTGKKPVGYFTSMGGIILSNINPDVIVGALANAPSPPPNTWGSEAFEELKKKYPAGKYVIDFSKSVDFPGLKAYWDDTAQLQDPSLPRVGEKGKGPFMTRDGYAAIVRPFPPRMFAVISDYHYVKDGKVISWYKEDMHQAVNWDGHALPPTHIITGLQDWRHAPDTYAADHKLWRKLKFKDDDLQIEYWDQASHIIQVQPAMPKLVNAYIYWMKIHGWSE